MLQRQHYLIVLLTIVVVLVVGCSNASTPIPTEESASSSEGAAETSAQQETREVEIAVVGPMSGDLAINGQNFVEGVRLALDEVNGQGGVNGVTFKVQTYDDRADPTEATSVAQRISTNDDVLAVIGHYTSGTVFAAQPVYDRAKIPHFTPSASHPDLTKNGEYTFRLWSSIEEYQPQGAEFAVSDLGLNKQAIIYVNNDWGKASFDAWTATVEENGGEVVLVETVLDGDKDFKSQLDKVAASDADGLVLLTYYPEGALIVSQAKSLGIDLPVAASATFMEPQFLEVAGDAANGIIFNTEFHEDRPIPAVQEFVAKFHEKYPGKDIGLYHPTAYDAALMIVEAVANVGPDREKVRDYIVNLDSYEGVSGTYIFAGNREPQKENVFVQIKDGGFELYQP
jgi:branched-chain amino acid transport system substrate-binding protein